MSENDRVDLDTARTALSDLIAEVERWRVTALTLVRQLMDQRDEAVKMVADMVVKATEYGDQDGGFVAFYLLPTGPIHRAIPWLQEHGITVRPGFDGREPVATTDTTAEATA